MVPETVRTVPLASKVLPLEVAEKSFVKVRLAAPSLWKRAAVQQHGSGANRIDVGDLHRATRDRGTAGIGIASGQSQCARPDDPHLSACPPDIVGNGHQLVGIGGADNPDAWAEVNVGTADRKGLRGRVECPAIRRNRAGRYGKRRSIRSHRKWPTGRPQLARRRESSCCCRCSPTC